MQKTILKLLLKLMEREAMTRKEKMNLVLSKVAEDKKEAFIAELREAKTPEERLKLVKKYNVTLTEDELKAVRAKSTANLPYAISSVFIAKLLECRNRPRSMFFMLQKEMAERLAAVPDTKAYGALSVRVQLLYKVKIEKIVPPEVFCPPPEVESALISFELRDEPLCSDEENRMVSRVVRTAFNQRRKQLGKVLGQMFGKTEVAEVFTRLGLPMEIRPDKLQVTDFVAIARQLQQKENVNNG